MPTQGVPVILFAARHRFTCAIPTGGRRLLDVLNDPVSAFLRLRNVEVTWVRWPSAPIDSLSRCAFRKRALRVVAITSEAHEAPRGRERSFVSKVRYPVFLTLPGYEVRGTLHLPRWGDPLQILHSDEGEFFPLTTATLSWGGAGRGSLAAPVMLVRKAWVDLLAVGERDG